MRANPAVVHLVSIALAMSGLACASSTRVGLDESQDFSRFHAWDWHGRVAPLVDGQHGGGRDLDGLLSRLIERGLAARGYERSRRSPDFFVTYRFKLERRVKVVQVPMAPYLLSSHHSSASYWIEGSTTERRPYQDLKLAVAIVEPGGRVVWKGVLETEIDVGERPALGELVASVLERFPMASDRPPESYALVGN